MAHRSHRKSWVSGFLLLAYLLVGGGIGHGLIWCHEADAFSHLEYNLSGSCQEACPPGDSTAPSNSRQGGLSCASAAAADCLDSPVALSHAASAKLRLPSPAVLVTAWAGRVSRDASRPEVSPRRRAPSAQPPSQALVALRSTVLLH